MQVQAGTGQLLRMVWELHREKQMLLIVKVFPKEQRVKLRWSFFSLLDTYQKLLHVFVSQEKTADFVI